MRSRRLDLRNEEGCRQEVISLALFTVNPLDCAAHVERVFVCPLPNEASIGRSRAGHLRQKIRNRLHLFEGVT